MRQLFSSLWKDNRGSVATGDWVFVTTILVLGAVTGLVTMRQTRLADLASAIKPLPVHSANHLVDGR